MSTTLARGAADVELWHALLDVDDPQLAALAACLSTDERQRAAGFHADKDRQHFIAARGTLRRILGAYLGIDASEVAFAYGAFGKPRLVETPTRSLKFNVSHSGNLAVYAISVTRDVGIDVERMSASVNSDDLARRFFSTTEQAALASLPANSRVRAFYECWTRKEAYLKAVGVGLSMPTKDFSVTLLPGIPLEITAPPGEGQSASRWSLHAVDAGKEYAAAVVVEGRDAVVNTVTRPVAITTCAFDAAVVEPRLPLLTDARTIIAAQEVAFDWRRLADLIARSSAIVMPATPAMGQMVIETGWSARK